MSDADRPRRPGVTGGGTDDTPTGGVSRSVTSSQTGPHDDLERQLRRHAQRLFAKPIADYNRNAFDQVTARMAAMFS